jgi:catechol 2,3-dioxygenase-like lactoylglutathione lyase family enzyme
MEPRISLITLGVSDLEASVRFYRDGLGLPMSPASAEDIAFFDLKGVVLALFPRDLLAEEAGVPSQGSGFGGFAAAHNVRTEEEVLAVLNQAERAGGTVTSPARKASWGGYSGYFADPDGHLWEVAYNPFFRIRDDGSIDLAPANPPE